MKAKLIELGSGTAGYIDDELPDYVMIMVANKRSKEQMTEDLSLFLGKNTDIFVSWLHQVLEKLQEVTLPSTGKFLFIINNFSFTTLIIRVIAVVQPKSKRKASEAVDKRDKKSKSRKRVANEKSPDSTKRSTTPPIQSAPTSITDVFADHLIQKARTVIEPPLSVKKAEKNNGSTNDGFDIPTISEIANKAGGNVVACRKEITELAELQKKIDQAKRQLNHIGNESDDEDFINLRADRIDFDADLSNNSRESASNDKIKAVDESRELIESTNPKPHSKILFNDNNQNNNAESDTSNKKRSILDRLGMKNQSENREKNENIISLSAHRRMEQAIYVAPAQRRVEKSSSTTTTPIKRTERERSSERSESIRVKDLRENRFPKDLREIVRQKVRDVEQRGNRTRDKSSDELVTRERSTIHKIETKTTSIASRIGSRVIVAKSKIDYVEDKIEVPVNSVVKVQPRPLIPKSKQASKNLLLRAVAEAQKSTALVKPTNLAASTSHEFKSSTERNTKELFTKSFRRNLQKDNIVVEIATNRSDETVIDVDDSADNTADEEYVPISASIDEDAFVYIPQAIHNTAYDKG